MSDSNDAEQARKRLLDIVNGRNLYGEFVPADGGRRDGITRGEQMQAANLVLQHDAAEQRTQNERAAKDNEVARNHDARMIELRLQEQRLLGDQAVEQAKLLLEAERVKIRQAEVVLELTRLAITDPSAREVLAKLTPHLIEGPSVVERLQLAAPTPPTVDATPPGSPPKS